MDNCTVDLRVPFPTAREAEIAYNSLRVDPEPKRSGVQKQLSVDGVHLCVYVFKLLFGASQDSTTTGYQEQVVRVQATEQDFCQGPGDKLCFNTTPLTFCPCPIKKSELWLQRPRLFKAKDAKSLRVGVNGFMDLLLLTTETIDQFGPPRPTT